MNNKRINVTVRNLLAIILCFCTIFGIAGVRDGGAYAAVETVTLALGRSESYGINGFSTTHRWVTHINGEPVDLDEEPGVSRSYAYCVQPKEGLPPAGTYKVTVIDDDGSGKVAKMRKMIYYLPGAYGYKSKTAKRWFSSNPEGTSDYCLGHVALSYLYDNCSENSDAWSGCGSGVKNKVKYMINDMKNLPDPPDDFEVFWVKVSGKQDTFGAFYSIEYGKAKMKKLSSLTTITADNNCYTLEGAEYTVYEDEACKTVAKTADGSKAVIRAKADGSSEPVTMEVGEYYVKETRAPRGYVLNTKVYQVEVEKDKTTTYTAYDTPKSNPAGLIIQKKDAETGFPKAQGAATLKGAEYELTYYDVTPPKGATEKELEKLIEGKEAASINGKPACWRFRTDEEGKIDFSNPDYLIEEGSAEMYRNSKGEVVLPIGIIAVKEVKAPRGYLLDEDIHVRGISENGETETLESLKAFDGADSLPEQVIRGDISFTKSSEGKFRMANIPFRITSVTTGETHVVVTDSNGYADTSSMWNKHSTNTNAGGNEEDGIWFNGYNSEESGAPVNDALSGLPYDTYKLEEMRCFGNIGHKLLSDTITIKRDKVTLDLGTYDDDKEPEPDKPGKPEEPDKPGRTNPPEEPGKTVKHKASAPQNIDEVRVYSPQTADETADLIIYAAMAVAALAGLGVLTIVRRNDRLKKSK